MNVIPAICQLRSFLYSSHILFNVLFVILESLEFAHLGNHLSFCVLLQLILAQLCSLPVLWEFETWVFAGRLWLELLLSEDLSEISITHVKAFKIEPGFAAVFLWPSFLPFVPSFSKGILLQPRPGAYYRFCDYFCDSCCPGAACEWGAMSHVCSAPSAACAVAAVMISKLRGLLWQKGH